MVTSFLVIFLQLFWNEFWAPYKILLFIPQPIFKKLASLAFYGNFKVMYVYAPQAAPKRKNTFYEHVLEVNCSTFQGSALSSCTVPCCGDTAGLTVTRGYAGSTGGVCSTDREPGRMCNPCCTDSSCNTRNACSKDTEDGGASKWVKLCFRLDNHGIVFTVYIQKVIYFC